MPMNIVIQEQRKLLGLTQEQVADYLGVSTPAVSKWEKGITSPDAPHNHGLSVFPDCNLYHW